MSDALNLDQLEAEVRTELDEKFKRWVLDNLPILPDEFRFKPKKGQGQRIRTIAKLLAREDVGEIVNACDAGREGELIFNGSLLTIERSKCQ